MSDDHDDRDDSRPFTVGEYDALRLDYDPANCRLFFVQECYSGDGPQTVTITLEQIPALVRALERLYRKYADTSAGP